jgi:hypothetical protein
MQNRILHPVGIHHRRRPVHDLNLIQNPLCVSLNNYIRQETAEAIRSHQNPILDKENRSMHSKNKKLKRDGSQSFSECLGHTNVLSVLVLCCNGRVYIVCLCLHIYTLLAGSRTRESSLVLSCGAREVAPTLKDKSLLSSRRRPHFQNTVIHETEEKHNS